MTRSFLDHLQSLLDLQTSQRPTVALCCDPQHSLHKLLINHSNIISVFTLHIPLCLCTLQRCYHSHQHKYLLRFIGG
jgi:hypothetical protein